MGASPAASGAERNDQDDCACDRNYDTEDDTDCYQFQWTIQIIRQNERENAVQALQKQ